MRKGAARASAPSGRLGRQAVTEEGRDFSQQGGMPGQFLVLDVKTGDLGGYASGDQGSGVLFGFPVQNVAFGRGDVGRGQALEATAGEGSGVGVKSLHGTWQVLGVTLGAGLGLEVGAQTLGIPQQGHAGIQHGAEEHLGGQSITIRGSAGNRAKSSKKQLNLLFVKGK